MQFEIPTTKEKMYEVLSDIFYYYRIKKDDYIDFILPDLTLERMQMTVQTPEQIRATATTTLSPKQTREIAEYKAKIEEKISEVNDLIDQEETSKNNQISEVNSKYLLDVAELNRQATDKGFLNSSMYTEMLASLENEKNQKIALITEQSATTIARLNEQITTLNQKIENAEEYFADIFSAEINAKVIELEKEQQEKQTEVFKYNNSIEEKCQRYRGTVETTNANLRIKYLQINTEFFSKDELVDMGYYRDAIKCVCDYYDTLSPTEALQDLTNETKVIVYLDDFYQDVIYMYRARAGI